MFCDDGSSENAGAHFRILVLLWVTCSKENTPIHCRTLHCLCLCSKGNTVVIFYQGKRTVDAEGHESINDMYTENNMLQTENDRLRQRIKVLSDAIESLKADNAHLMAEAAAFSLMGQNGTAEPTAIRGTRFDPFTALWTPLCPWQSVSSMAVGHCIMYSLKSDFSGILIGSTSLKMNECGQPKTVSTIVKRNRHQQCKFCGWKRVMAGTLCEPSGQLSKEIAISNANSVAEKGLWLVYCVKPHGNNSLLAVCSVGSLMDLCNYWWIE